LTQTKDFTTRFLLKRVKRLLALGDKPAALEIFTDIKENMIQHQKQLQLML
jgi:hypothetical protein